MTLEEFRSLLGQALDFYNSEHTSTEIDEGVSGGLGAVRYDIPQTLAEAQKATARKNLGIEGGGAGGGNFEAIYDVTTAAEIEEAYQAGMTITMNNNGVIFYLRERINENMFVFTTAPYYVDIFKEIYIYTATVDGITWSSALTKAEPTSNKVTTIDENSTNKQYPSAKAVFDFVNENGGGSGADLLNADGIIKQQYFPAGYPYSQTGEDYILPETAVTLNEDGEAILTDSLGLVEGQTYSVNWNGTDYECDCVKVEMAENGDGVADIQMGVGLGNIGFMTGGDDTGEPFVIIDVLPELAAALGAAALVQALDGSTSVTLSITGITEVTNPIAQKYLPIGYPYFIPGGEVILEETNVNANSVVAPTLNIKLGYTYAVTFNGEAYECTATTLTQQNISTITLGNQNIIFGGVATGEPFLIVFAPASGWNIYMADGISTATLSIVQADTYKKIDSRYMPDTGKTLVIDLVAEETGSVVAGEYEIISLTPEPKKIWKALAQNQNLTLRYKSAQTDITTEHYTLASSSPTTMIFTKLSTESNQPTYDEITLYSSGSAQYERKYILIRQEAP